MFATLFEGRSLENPATPITGEDCDDIGGNGLSVSPERAMKLSAVYSCIYVLASNISQLPLAVMRKSDGVTLPATDHPAYYLLHDSPNFWQTSYKWRETKQNHILGWGNGYSIIERSKRGEIEALTMAKPWNVELIKRDGRYVYAVTDDDTGQVKAVSPYDMVHIRAIGSHGKKGRSPIQQNRDSMELGMSAQRYGNQFFAGGGRATGVLTLKNGGVSNKDLWASFQNYWNKAKRALKDSDNKTLMLPADLDYKSLTIPPEDAQFLDTRKYSRSEIAGIFNVPAHMINDLEKATFSNISEQAIYFVRHSMMPWIVNWEQELNRRIFTKAERAAGYYVKFNLAGLLRGTPKERAEFYHYAITDGWMDRNEARAFEDMNSRDGLDEMLVSVNAQPLSALNQESTNDEQ
ncbi:MAG: phage portal protein [Neptuniibacter sp. Phe_28]|nr:MAG: phage portal protein [Neptuniibacter sp. Phe_28]